MQGQQESGVASKIVLIVITLLVCAGVLGVIAFRMANNNIDPTVKKAIENAECAHVDENVCKFFASSSVSNQYVLQATEQKNDTSITHELRAQDKDTFELTVTSDGSKRQTLAIGEHVLIKADDDETWRQQTIPDAENRIKYREIHTFDFLAKPESEAAAAAFVQAGEEACGELTCFRYQYKDGDDTTTYFWFDNQEYRLRRVLTTGDSYSYDAQVRYESVAVSRPENVSTLERGMYIPPGKTEPESRVAGSSTEGGSSEQTLPNTGDSFDPEEYRLWLQQRQRAGQ